MGYELTEIDIGNLFRILVGKSGTFEADVRFWFTTLPVVAATDVERPAPSGPDPLAEPTDAETKTAYDRFRAQPGGMGSALRHVLVGFVADRRKAAPPHAPEPTKTETPKPDEFRERAKWAIRGYWRGAGLEWVRDTLEALFGELFPGQSIRIREDDVEPPSSAPEPTPPPPAVDYMVFRHDRIEFRENGSGQHDPVVATISAGAFLGALTAISTAMEKGVDS